MCSNKEDNKKILSTLKLSDKEVISNLNLGVLLIMFGLSIFIGFMVIPEAFAQNDSKMMDSVTKGALENDIAGIENETGISNTNETGAISSNFDTNIRNLSLQSFSSFVDQINKIVRDKSSDSDNNNVTNTFSPPLSSSPLNSSDVASSSPLSSSSSSTPQSKIQDTILSMLLDLNEVVIQNTSMSVPAPVRHPGQPSHEVVFALPLRNDGYIWTGTVTFTASKPIEVEVLHTYAPQEKPDDLHGEPYYAVLPGNKSIAITHLRHLVDVPIELNGTGISSGTLEFAGNALVFHKTSGEPFTVTYTIDAVSKKITQLGK